MLGNKLAIDAPSLADAKVAMKAASILFLEVIAYFPEQSVRNPPAAQ